MFTQIKLKIFGPHLMGLGQDKNADVKSKFFKAEVKDLFHGVLVIFCKQPYV